MYNEYSDKTLVSTFVSSDLNTDRSDSKVVKFNGREYIALGTRAATTVVGILYKVHEPSDNHLRYVLLVGVARQHPCDVKISLEEGVDIATQNALISPVMTMRLEDKINEQQFIDIANVYANTMKIRLVKTKAEMIFEGREEDLYNKKYSR